MDKDLIKQVIDVSNLQEDGAVNGNVILVYNSDVADSNNVIENVSYDHHEDIVCNRRNLHVHLHSEKITEKSSLRHELFNEDKSLHLGFHMKVDNNQSNTDRIRQVKDAPGKKDSGFKVNILKPLQSPPMNKNMVVFNSKLPILRMRSKSTTGQKSPRACISPRLSFNADMNEKINNQVIVSRTKENPAEDFINSHIITEYYKQKEIEKVNKELGALQLDDAKPSHDKELDDI